MAITQTLRIYLIPAGGYLQSNGLLFTIEELWWSIIILLCGSEDHEKDEGGADDDVDDEVDDEHEEPHGGAGGVPLELLVVGKHVAPRHVPHRGRVVAVASAMRINVIKIYK